MAACLAQLQDRALDALLKLRVHVGALEDRATLRARSLVARALRHAVKNKGGVCEDVGFHEELLNAYSLNTSVRKGSAGRASFTGECWATIVCEYGLE